MKVETRASYLILLNLIVHLAEKLITETQTTLLTIFLNCILLVLITHNNLIGQKEKVSRDPDPQIHKKEIIK